jgi:histidine ammonia-lyase
MSRTSRNFVVAYILLVGLPLLGLAGVLRSGRSLTAPVSVDGTWKLEADSRPISQPCAKAISSLSSAPLVISQSGKSLALTINGAPKTAGQGAIEGKNITAAFDSLAALTSSCGNGSRIKLTAIVDPKSEPRSLAGYLLSADCVSCEPVPFHAVRQPKAQGGGAH